VVVAVVGDALRRRWSGNYLLTLVYMWPTFVREYLLRARTWSCTGLDHAVLVRPRDEARASLRSISACQYAHAFSTVRDTCATPIAVAVKECNCHSGISSDILGLLASMSFANDTSARCQSRLFAHNGHNFLRLDREKIIV